MRYVAVIHGLCSGRERQSERAWPRQITGSWVICDDSRPRARLLTDRCPARRRVVPSLPLEYHPRRFQTYLFYRPHIQEYYLQIYRAERVHSEA